MENFGSIESFIRSAEAGSFAEAARRLSLTPAAVGKTRAFVDFVIEQFKAQELYQRFSAV